MANKLVGGHLLGIDLLKIRDHVLRAGQEESFALTYGFEYARTWNCIA